MSRSSLTVAAIALAIASAAPAMAADGGGGWAIDRGDNAANVQVRLAPVPEDRAAAVEPGCMPAPASAQYTFPSAAGVTVYITPGYGPYLAPYGAAGYSPFALTGSGASPRVVVWASPGGGTY